MVNDDFKTLEAAIEELKITLLNNLIKSNLIKNVNKTITQISYNQEIGSNKIQIIRKEFDKTIFNFTHYMKVRDA